jgi:hypothetical protein
MRTIELLAIFKLRFQETNGRKFLGLLAEKTLFELGMISSGVHLRDFKLVGLCLLSRELLVPLA